MRYPLLLNLADRPALIVGGGNVARRKAIGLLQAGARVTTVSPAFHAAFPANIERIISPYDSSQMARQPFLLAFAATDDARVNAQVAADAASLGIWCSRADAPDTSDFINPAVGTLPTATETVGITLMVATEGASPALAAKLRDHLLARLDPMFAVLVGLFPAWRRTAQAEVPDPAARRLLLQALASDEMIETLRAHGIAAAQAFFTQRLAAARAPLPLSPSPPPTPQNDPSKT